MFVGTNLFLIELCTLQVIYPHNCDFDDFSISSACHAICLWFPRDNRQVLTTVPAIRHKRRLFVISVYGVSAEEDCVNISVTQETTTCEAIQQVLFTLLRGVCFKSQVQSLSLIVSNQNQICLFMFPLFCAGRFIGDFCVIDTINCFVYFEQPF